MLIYYYTKIVMFVEVLVIESIKYERCKRLFPDTRKEYQQRKHLIRNDKERPEY